MWGFNSFFFDKYVGIQFLRKLFLFYMELLMRRMLLLWIIWSSWVVLISGARAFLDKRMTEKWMSLLLFLGIALGQCKKR
jgi:hypothetical protein